MQRAEHGCSKTGVHTTKESQVQQAFRLGAFSPAPGQPGKFDMNIYNAATLAEAETDAAALRLVFEQIDTAISSCRVYARTHSEYGATFRLTKGALEDAQSEMKPDLLALVYDINRHTGRAWRPLKSAI